MLDRPGVGPAPMSCVLKLNRHLAHPDSFRDCPVIFITACTARRRRLLAADNVHQILREIWSRSAQENGWHVGNYIIMPDHIHLFARPDLDARSLKRWVATWKSLSARKIAETLLLRPPIWQPDYFDRYLRSRDSYSAKRIYVEHNAVRAGLVECSDEWPYKGVINTLMFN